MLQIFPFSLLLPISVKGGKNRLPVVSDRVTGDGGPGGITGEHYEYRQTGQFKILVYPVPV